MVGYFDLPFQIKTNLYVAFNIQFLNFSFINKKLKSLRLDLQSRF